MGIVGGVTTISVEVCRGVLLQSQDAFEVGERLIKTLIAVM